MKKLVIATKNQGKLLELKEILAGLNYEILSLNDYPDAPEVEETGKTFLENAVLKAMVYSQYTNQMVLADDSGLEVDALNSAPGVYSSRFAETDEARIAKLLDMLKDETDDKRTARFKCVIAVCNSTGNIKTAEGALEGVIAKEPKGSGGFGYDPIMFIKEYNQTVAEMEAGLKNSISHRGKALKVIREML
jgi:XTP/dITP diphosphohydrolase